MKQPVGIATLAIACALFASNMAQAGTITQYTDVNSFDTAISGAVSVEDFTNSVHYPIPGGTLNSATNVTVTNGSPITPGMILPGVTYSTPAGTGYYFNIDGGLYFTGGFLDRTSGGSNNNANVALTTTFDQSVNGFGFLTSPLMGTELNVTINFTLGSPAVFSNLSIPANDSTSFFGFVSNATDITSATIYGNSPDRPFTIDNFTYPEYNAAVPEPASIVMMGLAVLAGVGTMWRNRGV